MDSSEDCKDQTDELIEVVFMISKKFPLKYAEPFFQFAEKFLGILKTDLNEIQTTYTDFTDQQLETIKSWRTNQGNHGTAAKLLKILKDYQPPEIFNEEDQQSNEASAQASNTPALDHNPATPQSTDCHQLEAQSQVANSPERESKPRRSLDIEGGEIGTFTYGAKSLVINKQKKVDEIFGFWPRKAFRLDTPDLDNPLEKNPKTPRSKEESPAQIGHLPTEARLRGVKLRHAVFDTEEVTVNEDNSLDGQQHEEQPAVSNVVEPTSYNNSRHDSAMPIQTRSEWQAQMDATKQTQSKHHGEKPSGLNKARPISSSEDSEDEMQSSGSRNEVKEVDVKKSKMKLRQRKQKEDPNVPKIVGYVPSNGGDSSQRSLDSFHFFLMAMIIFLLVKIYFTR